MPSSRRLLLWLMLCVLPLHGLAAVWAQGAGGLHFHAAAARPSAAALDDPMRGWSDFRRQVGGAGQAITEADFAHGHAHDEHAHDGVERHHHAGLDASVVPIGAVGGESAAADDAAGSTAGALNQALGPLGDAGALPAGTARSEDWAARSPPCVATRQPAPLERPPRSA